LRLLGRAGGARECRGERRRPARAAQNEGQKQKGAAACRVLSGVACCQHGAETRLFSKINLPTSLDARAAVMQAGGGLRRRAAAAAPTRRGRRPPRPKRARDQGHVVGVARSRAARGPRRRGGRPRARAGKAWQLVCAGPQGGGRAPTGRAGRGRCRRGAIATRARACAHRERGGEKETGGRAAMPAAPGARCSAAEEERPRDADRSRGWGW